MSNHPLCSHGLHRGNIVVRVLGRNLGGTKFGLPMSVASIRRCNTQVLANDPLGFVSGSLE